MQYTDPRNNTSCLKNEIEKGFMCFNSSFYFCHNVNVCVKSNKCIRAKMILNTLKNT